MKKISVMLFSISLILLFSPTFIYYILRGTVQSFQQLLIISVAPFFLGIVLSLISRRLESGKPP